MRPSLVPMQDRFKAATDLLAKAAKTITNQEIKDAVDELTVYGQGDNSLFALRTRELAAIAERRPDHRSERHDPALARPRRRAAGRRCREIDAERLGEADRGPLAQPHAAADRGGCQHFGGGWHRRLLRAAAAGAPPHLGRRRDAAPLLGRDRPLGAGGCRPGRDRRHGAFARSVPRRRDRAPPDGRAARSRGARAARARRRTSSR